ncbi:hypothetical protein HPP92_022022 [Vanilla planifolia]|uniref:Uncharacterized protein n=1 Tax=Vanilla planifolia TaxID=51239 RepID=A0A835PPI2_VANPL|nr:hypothetical protein HPP92_022346 [Vanilla planifolia]KAG0458894.1 hypothetical protein HPP92_022022 [Vanilla planifolia]
MGEEQYKQLPGQCGVIDFSGETADGLLGWRKIGGGRQRREKFISSPTKTVGREVEAAGTARLGGCSARAARAHTMVEIVSRVTLMLRWGVQFKA